MLTAYIDESGYGAKDIIVLGGFIGNDEQWRVCAERWKSGLAPRFSLHMSDLRWGKKRERTRELLKKLGPIPHECGLIPVWISLRVSDYADLVDDTAVSRKLQAGYMMGVQYIGVLLLTLAQGLNEKIKIVLEYNEHFAPILAPMLQLYSQIFPHFQINGVSCLVGVELATKDSTCLTQPADYLVYARLQNLRDPDSLKAKLCSPILAPQPGVYAQIKREDIRKLMSSPSQKRIRDLGRQIEPYLSRLRTRRRDEER